MDCNFRGKILLLFSDLFSITEKSGTNIKGKYSSNQMNEEISVYSNDNSDTVINDDNEKMEKEEIKLKEENNNMVIEEEQKDNKEEEKNEKSSETEIDLNGEKNEKIKLYDQFWNIEKIMINPFMVC